MMLRSPTLLLHRQLLLGLSFLLSSSSFRCCSGLQLPNALRNRLPPFLGGAPWYAPGLTFECTGCGKCCQVNGDVWLAPEETKIMARHLNMTDKAFRELYTRKAVGPRHDRWHALMRGVGDNNPVLAPPQGGEQEAEHQAVTAASTSSPGGCVFLDPFGQCSVYPVRPVQCRTYPFWPSLVDARDDWEGEAVLPGDGLHTTPLESSATEEEEREGLSPRRPSRYWSVEEGGCEGIGATADLVDEKEIAAKRRLALDHWHRFPDEEIKETTWYL